MFRQPSSFREPGDDDYIADGSFMTMYMQAIQQRLQDVMEDDVSETGGGCPQGLMTIISWTITALL
jgi:hypothetical protein